MQKIESITVFTEEAYVLYHYQLYSQTFDTLEMLHLIRLSHALINSLKDDYCKTILNNLSIQVYKQNLLYILLLSPDYLPDQQKINVHLMLSVFNMKFQKYIFSIANEIQYAMGQIELNGIQDKQDENNIVKAQAAYDFIEPFWDHYQVFNSYRKLSFLIGDLRVFEDLTQEIILFYFNQEKGTWRQINDFPINNQALFSESKIYQENAVLYTSYIDQKYQIAFMTSYDLPNNKQVYDVPTAHSQLYTTAKQITQQYFPKQETFRRE
ncbi:hypothetical protein SS50377_23542 [Spironucleus salmonicida]|uniref:Uncharacterized protein n=1 Tax=Spironucleus salmonicida TaxID=348837 RepID=V6M593_9EUKA|nr:hypothetical protein SS50377_23542 [Spironucleus salmonicida]|eukprot:EST48524.1 Hypothetical protein SS50377_11134 [Spironucleus salmonicida]